MHRTIVSKQTHRSGHPDSSFSFSDFWTSFPVAAEIFSSLPCFPGGIGRTETENLNTKMRTNTGKSFRWSILFRKDSKVGVGSFFVRSDSRQSKHCSACFLISRQQFNIFFRSLKKASPGKIGFGIGVSDEQKTVSTFSDQEFFQLESDLGARRCSTNPLKVSYSLGRSLIMAIYMFEERNALAYCWIWADQRRPRVGGDLRRSSLGFFGAKLGHLRIKRGLEPPSTVWFLALELGMCGDEDDFGKPEWCVNCRCFEKIYYIP